jgi:3'-5' exonuclease
MSEHDLLMHFFTFLNKQNFDLLISANGKDFDIPFLMVRAYICMIPFGYGLTLMNQANKHFDIINDITSKKISLNDLARLYGFNVKTGDGLQAIRLYNEGKFDEIMDYCKNDVILTEQIFLKYIAINGGIFNVE